MADEGQGSWILGVVLDIRIEDLLFWSIEVVKEIPGSIKNQENRG